MTMTFRRRNIRLYNLKLNKLNFKMFWRKVVRNYSTFRPPNKNDKNDRYYLILGAATIVYISSKTSGPPYSGYYMRKY